MDDGLNFFCPSYRGSSALDGGDTRHVQPISLREGITEWSQNVLQGRVRPERRGPGGTDFFFPVKVRSYGVVEHSLAYAVPGRVDFPIYPYTPGSSESRGGGGHGRLVLLSSWRLRTCSRLV